MIAHLHASVNFFIYGLTNKSLRSGYHDFVVRRLCGVCCAATETDGAEYSSDEEDFQDTTMATRSRASRLSGRSFDAVRTSRPSRKTSVKKPTSVVKNELTTQSCGKHIKVATTRIQEASSVDSMEAAEHHLPSTGNNSDCVVPRWKLMHSCSG